MGDALDLFGNSPSGGMFSNFLSGIKDGINNNPEMFSIIADTLGRNIAPKNPFAGIGTAMGQSSLANKSRVEQQGVQQNFMEKLISGLGGMTPAGMPGANSVSTKLDKDGVPEHIISFNPPAEAKTTFAPAATTSLVPAPTAQPQINPQTALGNLMGVYPF